MLELAARLLKKEEGGMLIDSFVFRCGDTVGFLMTHREEDGIQSLVHRVLESCHDYLRKKNIFPPDPTSTVSCTLSFAERRSEEIVLFLADHPTPDLFNLHLYRIFGDPFTTTRLVTDTALQEGFVFTTTCQGSEQTFSLPEDIYRFLALIRRPEEVRICMVSKRDGEHAASVTGSPEAASPGLLLRTGGIFPDYGEAVEPFAHPYMVRSSVRDRPMMPLIPVSLCDAQGSRSGGPPRVVCLAFTLARGRLIGPADIFDDPGLDPVRELGSRIAGYSRSHGPFDPFV
jgi:fructose 1,6-bisphosphate aldolase/phosphatase